MSGAAPVRGEVEVLEGAVAVAEHAAAWVAACSAADAGDHGAFTIALAGGSTPKATYERLAAPPLRDRIDWTAWSVFYGDERAVPLDDEASNHRMASDALLAHVPVDPGRIHPMPGDAADLDAAAATYASLLADALPRGPGGAPRLDCVLLGLGDNGHTASLFPGTAALEVTDAWATRGRADYAPFDRITLTYPTLNAARRVAFLVVGRSKVEALRGTRAGTTPAARVAPADGELRWFLDTEAAEALR